MDCGPLDDLILTDGEDPRLSIYIAAAGQLVERERERERGDKSILVCSPPTLRIFIDS